MKTPHIVIGAVAALIVSYYATGLIKLQKEYGSLFIRRTRKGERPCFKSSQCLGKCCMKLS